MAPDSVDDMYSGCRDAMMTEMPKYLENEKNKDARLKEAWATAERLYKWKSPPAVGREQTLAIFVYTFVTGNMYRYLNDAVRSQQLQYKTTFGYHALHFLLTDAIQSINSRRLDNLVEGEERCLTVYRRVKERFRRDVVNTQFRFGAFTSTSMGRYPDPNVFGTESCFEIVTCMGGDFSLYSKYKNEGEVVIPPYEVFKVVEVLQNQPDLPCDVVYKVESTEEPVSNLNCALFNN